MKKSWKKRLFKWLGVFLLLLVVTLVAIYIWLGNIITVGINTMGEKALGVKQMHVDSVSPNLLAGRFYLKGLFIGNPQGYDSDYLFKVDEVRIDVKPLSWFGKVFVINEIYIDGPKVIYHKGGPTGSNVNQVIKNLNDFVGVGGSKPDPAKPEPKPKSSFMEKKVLAHRIVIKNMGAKLVLWGMPAVPMTIGDITLSEVGNPNGVTMVALIEQMLLDSINVFEKGAQLVGNVASGVIKGTGGIIKGTGGVIKGTGGVIKGVFKKDEPALEKTETWKR